MVVSVVDFWETASTNNCEEEDEEEEEQELVLLGIFDIYLK